MNIFDYIHSPKEITNDLEAISFYKRLSDKEKKEILLCLLFMIANRTLVFAL